MLNTQKYAAIKSAAHRTAQAIRQFIKLSHGIQQQEQTTIQPRRFSIPAENTMEILKLVDALDVAGPGSRRKYAYTLWARIAEIYPDIKSGNWHLQSPTALTVDVVEVVENDTSAI